MPTGPVVEYLARSLSAFYALMGALCLVLTTDLERYRPLVRFLASLTAPLAEAGISVFAISTFDTDYLLVKAEDLGRAVDILRRRAIPSSERCRSQSPCTQMPGRAP
jgi:hypothetical protein